MSQVSHRHWTQNGSYMARKGEAGLAPAVHFPMPHRRGRRPVTTAGGGHLPRRTFLALAATATLHPIASGAQGRKVPTVGVLVVGVPGWEAFWRVFRQATARTCREGPQAASSDLTLLLRVALRATLVSPVLCLARGRQHLLIDDLSPVIAAGDAAEGGAEGFGVDCSRKIPGRGAAGADVRSAQ